MTLFESVTGTEYIVDSLNTDDEELESFLFTLGCYEGQTIGYVSKTRSNIVLSIKDGRYNIDAELAKAINVK